MFIVGSCEDNKATKQSMIRIARPFANGPA
jgi:hypothetical protein